MAWTSAFIYRLHNFGIHLTYGKIYCEICLLVLFLQTLAE